MNISRTLRCASVLRFEKLTNLSSPLYNLRFTSTLKSTFPTFTKSTMSSDACRMDAGKEIRIPVPWGHLAGREYGSPNGQPVLLIHGWLDNCGTFDLLLPYLQKENDLHIIAIDEGGCGLSTHKPPGSEYHFWSLLKDMKKTIDYLKWKDVILIGHSKGGIFSNLFASIFPDLIQGVVCIDAFSPAFEDGSYPLTGREADIIHMHLRTDQLYLDDPTLEKSAPIYSKEEAIQKVVQSTRFGLNRDTAEVLLKRGMKPLKHGYTFSRDIRLKLPPLEPMPNRAAISQIFSRIRSDLMVIMATDGPFSDREEQKLFYFDLYRRNCRTFKDELVKGRHYIHLDSPDIVGKHINEFIKQSIERGPIIKSKY